MNTHNTFLRYFLKDDEKFISIAELDCSGCPVDEYGDLYECDDFLYRISNFNEETKTYNYEKIS